MMVVEMVGAKTISQVDLRLYEDMMVFQEKKLEEIMIMGEEEHETIKVFLVHSDNSIG